MGRGRNKAGLKAAAWALAAAMLAAACAKQAFPNGGPKDTDPPRVVGTQPENASRNFSAGQFYLQFDEYVELKDAANNVLVSPPMEHRPEFSTKGKGVLVRLKDTLQPGTTYLFQFRDAIADYNEGNLLPEYEYVFSTGEDLDTLQLCGQVEDALTGKPWKETVTVMAYSPEAAAGSDTAATHRAPTYVTRCDKEGHFCFHHLKAGGYRLVAIADQNRNLRLDASEAAAWDTATHAALPTADSVHGPRLKMSTPQPSAQRIMKSEFTARGQATIVTRLPMQQPQIESEQIVWRLNAGRDTIRVWCLDPTRDSLALVLSDTDFADTLHLRYRPVGGGRNKGAFVGAQKTPLVSARGAGTNAYYDALYVDFANPIAHVDDSARVLIRNMKDSSEIQCSIRVDSTGLHGKMEAELKGGETYRATIPAGMFTDIYGEPNDSLSFTLSPKDYATLTLHLSGLDMQRVVIEVLDKNDTVIRREAATLPADLRFAHLSNGEYRIRAISDHDGNGRWTPGNYRLGTQPEPVTYFPKTLQLREKWEIEERWEMSQIHTPTLKPAPGIPGRFTIE